MTYKYSIYSLYNKYDKLKHSFTSLKMKRFNPNHNKQINQDILTGNSSSGHVKYFIFQLELNFLFIEIDKLFFIEYLIVE